MNTLDVENISHTRMHVCIHLSLQPLKYLRTNQKVLSLRLFQSGYFLSFML